MKRCTTSSGGSSHESSHFRWRRWLQLMVIQGKRGLKCCYKFSPFCHGRKHVCCVPLQISDLCLNILALCSDVILYIDQTTFKYPIQLCMHINFFWFLFCCKKFGLRSGMQSKMILQIYLHRTFPEQFQIGITFSCHSNRLHICNLFNLI